MSPNRFLSLAALLLSLNPAIALAELVNIKVIVSNISPVTGTVEVSLFNSAESFLKEPYLQESGQADQNGKFETVFPDLREGDYAVVVVHDANDNGKLDSGFLGFGGENYSYSNQAGSWLGRPDFEDAKVPVSEPETRIEIDLD